MILCVAGDIHGAIERFYDDVVAFERSLGVVFDWVLQVGDFGIWPNPGRVDRATLRHDGAGDFPLWLAERRLVPRPTLFIKGNHEDFVWLEAQPHTELLPGLHYLRNGEVRELKVGNERVRIGGMGGCFGPSDYGRASGKLQSRAKRHYTEDEIARLASSSGLDLLLTHDAPAGVRFERHRRGAGYVSEAAGLDEVLRQPRPRLCFFGHHHTRLQAEVAGVPCHGLNKVGMPGHMVALIVAEGFRVCDWAPAG